MGKPLKQVFREIIFDPLVLQSAHYNEKDPVPEGCVKGYLNIYGIGTYVEGECF